MPPLAMVETMETSCTGVTPTSWPMAMEPIDEPHRLTGAAGRGFRRAVPDAGAASRSRSRECIDRSGRGRLERQLDGGDVAGVLRAPWHRDDAHSGRFVVVNDAAGEGDLSALAVDHVVGRDAC
jgi:hypothetical protein